MPNTPLQKLLDAVADTAAAHDRHAERAEMGRVIDNLLRAAQVAERARMIELAATLEANGISIDGTPFDATLLSASE